MTFPETVMKHRCADCAMRPGTEAATSPLTQHLLRLCIAAGVPFECHDSGSGHLCKGFVDAFTAKLRIGDYDRIPEWKNQLYRRLIDVIHDYHDAAGRGESFDVEAAMSEAISAVGWEGVTP